MVMDSDFGTTQAAEIFLSHVCAGILHRIGLLIVDTLYFEVIMKAILRTGFMAQLKRRLTGQPPTLVWSTFSSDERTVRASSHYGSQHID